MASGSLNRAVMAAPVPTAWMVLMVLMALTVPMVAMVARGSLSSNPFVSGDPYEPSPTPVASASVIGSIPF